MSEPRLLELFPAPVPFDSEFRYRVGNEIRTLRSSAPGSRGGDEEATFRNEDLSVSTKLSSIDSGVVIDWSLEAQADIDLDQVLSVSLRWPWNEPPSSFRIFQNGFQSWTPTGSHPAASAPRRPLLKAFSTMNHHVDSPYFGRRDGLLSHEVVVLGGPDRHGCLLMGFVSAKAGLGELFVRNGGEPGIEASLDYGGKRVRKGEVLEGEPLMLLSGADALSLLERWADSVGRAMAARVGQRSPVGWCSWYEYYDKVRESDVLANIEVLRAHPELGVDLMQLDDGYQASIGDWLSQRESFPSGLGRVAEASRSAGMTAGIWLAPFFAQPRSRLFREHPEWFLRDDKGRLIDAGFNPVWRSRLRSLDLTHPGVEEWLRGVFSGLTCEGYDYFKIDFVYAGLRHGRRHDPSMSPAEAYRNGLRIIRETIGEDRFLLGCGAPLSPSVGFVDAMRIGADVKERWDEKIPALIAGGAGYPSARPAIAGTIARSFMHRRLWLNDPDCLLVRDRNTDLTSAEIETLLTVLGMSGGMLFLSDDMTALSEERLELAKAVLPPSSLCARPTRIMDENPPKELVLQGEGRRLIALVNWDKRPQEIPLPIMARGATVFDFWPARLLEQGERITIAAHGTKALLVSEPQDRPFVIGTDLHLAALADGRVQDEWDPKARVLTIRGRDMAKRRGRIWVQSGPDDEMNRDDPPKMVEQVKRWAGGWVLTLACGSEWSLKLGFDS